MRTFTFGFDHKHPLTGESLARHYIQVPGDDNESRAIMLAVFGKNWAMQYESPKKLKYLDQMTELKWTEELISSAKDSIVQELEAVTDARLRKHMEDQERAEAIDSYFDLQKQLPHVTTITGEPVVEYAMQMVGGGVQTFHSDAATEQVYPLAKQIRHHMTYGGTVRRRRILVIEDWIEVTEEEADEMCKPYDEHTVDLAEDKKGTILP